MGQAAAAKALFEILSSDSSGQNEDQRVVEIIAQEGPDKLNTLRCTYRSIYKRDLDHDLHSRLRVLKG